MKRTEPETSEDSGQGTRDQTVATRTFAKGLPSTCVPELPPAPTLDQLHNEAEEAATIDVPEIDAEHHRLIAHYYALLAALSRGVDGHTFALRYHLFIRRVRLHFAQEERIMQDAGFDDYDHHKVLRIKLLRDAERFLAKLVRGEDRSSRSWLPAI